MTMLINLISHRLVAGRAAALDIYGIVGVAAKIKPSVQESGHLIVC